MTNEEIIELYKKATTEEEKNLYREECINNNRGLIMKVALNYKETEDLFQEGCIVLMSCMDLFDVNSNIKFSTYLTTSLRRRLFREYVNNRTIRVPVHYYENNRDGRELNDIHIHITHEYSTFDSKLVSLFDLISETHQYQDHFDMYYDDCINTYVKIFEDEDMERGILICYKKFIEKLTYREIGAEFGISKPRVEQIIKKTINRLKKYERRLEWKK